MAKTLRLRLQWAKAAVKYTVLHPNEVMRIAALLELGNGTQFARQLHDRFPSEFTRRAGSHLLALGGGLEFTFERDGLTWRADLGDEIGPEVYATGRYEGAEIDAVLAWLRPHRGDGVVIDIGANVGTTAIPFAQAGYRVVAVEPVPSTYEMLRANVESNGFMGKIACVQRAVGEGSGEIAMWTGFGSGQSEVAVDGHAPALTRWGAARELIRVRVDPLDTILDESGNDVGDIALVWADVQGAETSAIRTGPKLWTAGVPLYLEVDPTSLELHGGLSAFFDAVETYFASFIHRAGLLAGEGPTPIGAFRSWVTTIGPNSYSDALLLPRGHPAT